MKSRNILILCLLGLLTACASGAEPKTYYLLAPPVPSAGVSGLGNSKPTLVIESVDLAEYLRQSGLVLQTGDNKLLISRTHLWAESLDQAVPKVLLGKLQRQSDDYRFYLKFSDFVQQTDFRLRLHFDRLQATDSGQVVTAGRYQLISRVDLATPVSVNFLFEENLTGDGYAHAVDRMQTLLDELAAAILETLDALAKPDH